MNLKLFLIFTSSFFYSLTYANDSFYTGLNFIFNSNTEVTKNSNSCNNDQSSPDEPLVEKCAIALCGKPSVNDNGSLTSSNLNKYVKSGYLEKFKKYEVTIMDIISKKIDSERKLLENMLQYINNNSADQLLSSIDYDTVADQLFSKYVQLNFDPEKNINKRVFLTPLINENMNPSFKKSLEVYINMKEKKNNTDFFFLLNKGIVEVSELKEKVNDIISNIENHIKKSQNFSKDEFVEIKNDFNTNFDKFTKYDFYSFYSKIMNIERELNLNIDNDLCGKGVCKNEIDSFVRELDLKSIIKTLISKLDNKKEIIEEKMANCKSEFAFFGMKDYDEALIMEKVKVVKDNFMKNALKHYSSESKSDFLNILNSHFHFSLYKPNGSEGQFAKNIEEVKSELEEGNASEYIRGQRILDYYFSSVRFSPTPKLFTNFKLCHSLFSAKIGDQYASAESLIGQDIVQEGAVLGKNNIRVSKHSCEHFNSSGKMALAHEFGHALSEAFSRDKLSLNSYNNYMNLRKCIQNTYTYKLPAHTGDLNHKGDFYRSEEDTADVIANLTYHDDKTIGRCSLLATDYKDLQYTHLELGSSNISNPHSSGFMRALQEAIHKRIPLDKSCNLLINKNKHLYRLNPCF